MSIWTFPHPSAGDLRAYLDNELDPGRMAALREHLAGCLPCRLLLDDVHKTAAFAAAQMGALHAVAGVAPPPANFIRAPLPKEASPMTRRPFTWKSIAAAVATLMALSLFIPDVRAAAADWISIFRVQRAQVLRISPAELQALAARNGGQLPQISETMLRDVVQVEQTVKSVSKSDLSLEQAINHGFRKPGYLPEGYQPYRGTYMSPSETMVRFDVDRVNDLLGLAGSKARLPAELKGQAIRVRTERAVAFVYTNGNQRLEILHGFTPELSASGNIDLGKTINSLVNTLGEEFGLPLSLRSQLASMDLTRTLPLPLVDGRGAEVKVKGHTGTYYTERGQGAIVWVSGNQLQVIAGALPQSELLRIAESLEG